jgi:hypothetical protein
MTVRTYEVTLRATITVDDATLQSSLLDFRLADEVAGYPATLEADTFEAQQNMLAAAAGWTPEQRMRLLLVNPYFAKGAPAITQMLEARLPGASVRMQPLTITVLEGAS